MIKIKNQQPKINNQFALFGLAFATVPGINPLTLLVPTNSMAHYAKGTRSLVIGY
jgi:hypothetical protein